MRRCELSQSQLADLRRDVRQLIAQLREDLTQIREQQRAELAVVDVAQPVDNAEQASASAHRVQLLAHIQQLEGEVRAAEHALQRLDDGLYGECESCGEMIELNRLKANPVAVLCIGCQSNFEG
ncbi:TraR/DksA family transcriptional regulator [Aliamphritea hakodatensis]|uniref:TraR/DksA family transcriptional regulator n=1 Tax=Aliamphritea hakodatensis TaxID=2895352 RepID=UPI0022FD49A9|nr:TraR/DksA family transcriptional regulator [Aliamphritea hakodatensis]